MLEDAELADPIVHMQLGIAGRIHRHPDDVVITAVALVDDAERVRLNQAEVFKGRAARRKQHLVTVRHLYRDTHADEAELALLQGDVLCDTEVDPVALPGDVLELLDLVGMIFDTHCFFHHAVLPVKPPSSDLRRSCTLYTCEVQSL